MRLSNASCSKANYARQGILKVSLTYKYMSKQNALITAVIVLAIALVAVIFINYPKETVAPTEVSNEMQNTNSESEETNSSSNEAPIMPVNENEEFEKSLSATSNNWTLNRVTVDQKKINMDVNVSNPITLQFDSAKNTYSGFAGCNSFSGTYSAQDNFVFSFGTTVSTKMACPSLNLEEAIFKAMSQTTRYGVKGTQLVFESTDGYTQLLYDPAK